MIGGGTIREGTRDRLRRVVGVELERHLGSGNPDMLLAIARCLGDGIIVGLAVLVQRLERSGGRIGEREQGELLAEGNSCCV